MATIQEMTDAAILIATDYYDDLAEAEEEDEDVVFPRFNGTTFVVPANDEARALEALCMAGVPEDVTGVVRATILATAVQTAEAHYSEPSD